MRKQQGRQKASHDLHAKAREFTPGTEVYVQNFGSGSSWLAEVVLEKRSPSSYLVKLTDGRRFRRHVDHLRIRLAKDVPSPPWDTSPWPEVATTEDSPSAPPDQPVAPPSLHRSSRVSRAPDRYGMTLSH